MGTFAESSAAAANTTAAAVVGDTAINLESNEPQRCDRLEDVIADIIRDHRVEGPEREQVEAFTRKVGLNVLTPEAE